MKARCPICTLYHSQPGGFCRTLPRSHRWPWQPLADALPPNLGRDAATIAAVLGVDPRTITDWQTNGLTDAASDRAATALKVHPCLVWGWEWLDVALTAVDRQRLEAGWRPAWLYKENAA